MFERVIEESGTKALSIIFMTDSSMEAVFQEMKGRGCYCEYGQFGKLEMLAVSVPANIEYDDIFTYLHGLEDREEISFAELAV